MDHVQRQRNGYDFTSFIVVLMIVCVVIYGVLKTKRWMNHKNNIDMKQKKSPVRFYSFDEFIQYGLEHSDNIVDGMPWSFEIHGYPVTHENDQCYIVPTERGMENFTPNHMLMYNIHGKLLVTEIPGRKQEVDLIPWSEIDIFIEAFHKTYGNKPWTTHSFRKALKNWLKTKEEISPPKQ